MSSNPNGFYEAVAILDQLHFPTPCGTWPVRDWQRRYNWRNAGHYGW